jgi:DNA-binding NtrC family response regulator
MQRCCSWPILSLAGERVTSEAGPTSKKQTILIVEDEASVRRLCRSVLLSAGYRVLEASDAAEAEALLERADEPVDLLLTDVLLPGTTGRELAERGRARHPALRIVIMSGYPETSVEEKRPGQARFLQKPFPPGVLLRVISEVLKR